MSLRRYTVLNAFVALSALAWLQAKPANALSMCVGGGVGEMTKTCSLDHVRSDGVRLNAEARFALATSGSDALLTLQLSNTSSAPVRALDQILQAFFFDLEDDITLSLFDPDGAGSRTAKDVTPGSAIVAFPKANCSVTPCPGVATSTTALGNNWDFKTGITTSGMNATVGVGSAGLDIFKGLSGSDYGLITTGIQNNGGGAWPTTQDPFVRNSVTFTFKVAKSDPNWRPGDINQLQLGKPFYNYGTDYRPISGGSDYLPGHIPEPGTLGLMGVGLAAAGWAGRRRRRKA